MLGIIIGSAVVLSFLVAFLLVPRKPKAIPSESLAEATGKPAEPPGKAPELPDLVGDGDDVELAAARFRVTVKKIPTHPMHESFGRAIVLLAREWGMSVKVEPHLYDFSDTEKHVVNVTFECESKKVRK